MVTRRSLLATLVVIGSGGCLRLSQNQPTATPGATASPTPVPTNPGGPATRTATATSTPPPPPTSDYPLGVSESGLTPLVADAHTSALAGQSFTIEFQHTDVIDGDRRLDTRTRFRDHQTLRDYRTQQASLFSTPTESVWRRDVDGDPLYGHRSLQILDLKAASYNGLIRGLVSAGSFDTVNRTGADGQVRFSATASQPGDDGTENLPWWIARESDRVESFSGEATILPAGIVESLTATLEVVRGDSLETHRSVLRVTDVGSTSFSTPSWVQTAKDDAPQIEAALVDGRRFLRLDHAGGVAIPPGAQIDIHGSSEAVAQHVENDDPIEAGDRIWLWRDQDTVHLDRGEKPSATPEPLDASGWFELQYGRSTENFGWRLFRVEFQEL